MNFTTAHEDSPVLEGVRVAPSVLVVDDSRLQRKIVIASLTRWGYQVEEAASAAEALAICAESEPDIVISDWMMPGMNGPEFCKEFRGMERNSYGYFILLTSKNGKGEVAEGLDAGADDFLSKPVSSEELRARLTAGERILRMEQKLVEQNRLVSRTLEELQTLYHSLDNDLVEARKLQQSLVNERFKDFGTAQASLLLRPSGHVGGDLVGFFPINDRRVGLFAIDVSGHGVASAMMTARLSGYLSGTSPDQNIVLFETEAGVFDALSPDAVAKELNRLTLTELETENYFTLLFADVDLVSGNVRMTQAGHPAPVVQRADGGLEFVGSGGMPVGLFEEAEFDVVEFKLNPGDRFFIMSDGITECEDDSGTMFGDDGLRALMHRNRLIRGAAFLETLTWDLATYSKQNDFADDVSAILLEFGGEPNDE